MRKKKHNISMDKWYKNIYRRSLVDMHINDDKKEYLSKFSAEAYFKYLVDANIVSPMIYLQSHTGLCNFPTKEGKTHEFFKSNPDEIKKLISLCKDSDMKVVGYYSLIFNNEAVYAHPEWEMVDENGKTWRENGQRYGLCCPNNEEYRLFLIRQIKEMLEFYKDIDAIFYDMPYWEVTCHCPSCQKKWKKISEEEMPKVVDWDNDEWKKYAASRQRDMVEFAEFIKKETNKIRPDITVEFNFAAVIGCDWKAGSTEGINASSEFTGGDLYGDLYNHSFTAKYYYEISKNQPFEYMVCRCDRNLREHTISKSLLTLESEIMLSSFHHGASLVIDAINPDGTLDKNVAKRIGKAFECEKRFEPYMNVGKMYGDVAVFFDSSSQYKYHSRANNKACAINASRTLIENHIPFRVKANGSLDNLNEFKMIIAPSKLDCDDASIDKFIEYVKEGGTLYLSSDSSPRLLKEFFDGEVVGETFGNSEYRHIYKGYDEVQCYVEPIEKGYKKIFDGFGHRNPLPVTYKLPLFSYKKGEEKASIILPYTDPDNNHEFASIHSNPPSHKKAGPAIVEVSYGKGKVIYSSALIENDRRDGFKNIFRNIMLSNVSPRFELKASKYVEMIVFEDDNEIQINLFDLNFADEINERKFVLKLNSDMCGVDLLTKKPCKTENGIHKGKFKKYASFTFKK